MLRDNLRYGDYMRYPSGTYNTHFIRNIKNNRTLCNAGLFGNTTSFPVGYRGQYAICMPLENNDYLAIIIRGDSSVSAQIMQYEECNATIIANSTVIANIVSKENLVGLAQGTSDGEVVGYVRELLTANVDTGARPSAFDIAQEIWHSKVTSYDSDGTMGKLLNSAGDPWQTELSSYTNEQAGAIINKILKIAKFLQIK